MKIEKTIESKRKWYNFVMGRLPSKWLEKRRYLDDLDGLWRVHDGLYDVTEFINKHPGGKFWLEETKGTDITELFESHHIKSNAAEQTLKNFYVRKTTKPRLSPYTFKDDGFYRTIKRKGMNVIKTLPKEVEKKSDLYTDGLLLLSLICAWLSNAYAMYSIACATSLFASFVIMAGHNYIHRQENFRMYYGEIFMVPTRFYRIMHVLSHHSFPNTTTDFQLTVIEPIANVFPTKKNFVEKYLSWIKINVSFLLTLYFFYIIGIVDSFLAKKLRVNILLPFLVPFVMHLFAGQTWADTLYMWHIIIICTSFITSSIAYATNHIHPDIYVEGDEPRTGDQLDWGIHQLDTALDKESTSGSHFFALATFGDHALHHLFPTLDHGQLQYLYPLLEQTLNELRLKNINIMSWIGSHRGFFQRAASDVPRKLL